MLLPFLLAVLATGVADVKETPRLLVLDLDAANMPVDEARAIDALVVANARVDGVALVTQAELRKLAELDAASQQIGCDTSSCLAEMAGALGARYVLFGNTSRLGSSITVSLSVFDATTSATNRDAITVKSLDDLAAGLPARVQSLVKAARGPLAADDAVAVTVVAPSERGPPVAGIVTTAIGGALFVGGAGTALFNEYVVVQDEDASGEEKRGALFAGRVGLGAAAVGAVVTVVGIVMIAVGSGE